MVEAPGAARTLGDYTQLLQRRWQYPAAIISISLVVALFVAYLLPVSYRATGTIMLEPQSLPTTMVPTTVVTDADLREHASEQLELVRRKVMTKENLVELAKTFDPYPDLKGVSLEAKAAMLGGDTMIERVDPITFQPLDKSTAFSIHYNNPDPKLAAEGANKLVDLFMTYNQRTRAEQAREAVKFLSGQAKQLEASMVDMEHELAQFRAKYGDSLPDAESRNLAGVERSQRELDMLQGDIRAQEQKESMQELQLKDISPSMVTAVSDWRVELAKLRNELALAQQKYTPEHPDVKRLQRAVADLIAQSANAPQGGAVVPDNPEYFRAQSELNATRRELGALRARAARIQSSMMGFQQNLSTTPTVEGRYVQLQRDYDNSAAMYRDVQSKIKAATLAESLESEARGERFALMKGPVVPKKPDSPNRLGIILLALTLGIGLGIAAAVVVDVSDPTVRSATDLHDIMAETPVAAVPLILNRVDQRRRRLVWSSVSAAYVAAGLVIALLVVTSQ